MPLYDEIAQLNLSSSHLRRVHILDQMKLQTDKGHDCSSCIGHCCTFAHNSMQVSPLETWDVYQYLYKNRVIDCSLKDKILACIEKFRLNQEVSLGRGRSLRRYYTCPFYAPGAQGCQLSRKSKPYGCLAFNPLKKNVSQEGNCTSSISLLEKREADFINTEKNDNEKLKEKLGLYWDKLSLPVALWEFISKIKTI